MCDFSVIDSNLPENPQVSSLFRWTERQTLCSPLFCFLNMSDKNLCLQKCKIHDLQKVEEVWWRRLSFLEGRYKLVWYEDMAWNSLKEIDVIYEFAGLEITTEMENWSTRRLMRQGKAQRQNLSTSFLEMLPSPLRHGAPCCCAARSNGFRMCAKEPWSCLMEKNWPDLNPQKSY